MKPHIMILGTAALVCGCITNNAREDIGILNASVAAAFANFDEAMTVRRTPIRFENDTVASTCETYLAAQREAALEETVHNQIVSQEYLICDTLEVLADTVEPRVKRPSAPSYGEELLNRLDLTSFPSSLGPAAEQCPLLADWASPARARVDETSVVLEQDDWYFELEVVAKGDVDQDGHEDWLVWLTDEALNGTYRDYALLVIYRVSGEDRLEANIVE